VPGAMSGNFFTLLSNSSIIFVMSTMAQVFSIVVAVLSWDRDEVEEFRTPSFNGGVEPVSSSS